MKSISNEGTNKTVKSGDLILLFASYISESLTAINFLDNNIDIFVSELADSFIKANNLELSDNVLNQYIVENDQIIKSSEYSTNFNGKADLF